MLLSAAAQALMPTPSLGQMEMKARTVTVREPVMPREMVYGRTRKGGVIVFLHSTGAKDKDLDLVVVLAAHRIKSIGAIYFEGEEAVDAAGVAQGRWQARSPSKSASGPMTRLPLRGSLQRPRSIGPIPTALQVVRRSI